METNNILSNQMQVRRPILLKTFLMLSVHIITDTSDIVAKGIQPNVNYIFLSKSTGIPQVKEERDTQRSCKPGFKKLFTISFFRETG